MSRKNSFTKEWVTYIDNQDFKIEYKFINCDPPMGYDTSYGNHLKLGLRLNTSTFPFPG